MHSFSIMAESVLPPVKIILPVFFFFSCMFVKQNLIDFTNSVHWLGFLYGAGKIIYLQFSPFNPVIKIWVGFKIWKCLHSIFFDFKWFFQSTNYWYTSWGNTTFFFLLHLLLSTTFYFFHLLHSFLQLSVCSKSKLLSCLTWTGMICND